MYNELTYTVLGYLINSFTDKITGKEIEYARIYAVENEVLNENQVGQKVEILKVSPELLTKSNLKVGSQIAPLYNRFGKVSAIEVLE